MSKKLRLVKDISVKTLEAYEIYIPAGTVLEVEEVEEVEDIDTKDWKEISYLDNMTFAQTLQKLIFDAGIPRYEWIDVKDFYPVDKNGKKTKETPTGKTITVRTPNVLDCTSNMCNKSADEALKEPTEWLSPVAYLHWLSELWKGGEHLDAKTWTMFPNWRNEAGRVPAVRFSVYNGRFDVVRDHADVRYSSGGVRPGVRIKQET